MLTLSSTNGHVFFTGSASGSCTCSERERAREQRTEEVRAKAWSARLDVGADSGRFSALATVFTPTSLRSTTEQTRQLLSRGATTQAANWTARQK